MDIPETGAIFSLGKSHLVENNQSYFFVKNDPVKKLVSGANQSAVICGSGRLFVWGENQFGQLATGDGEPAEDDNDDGGDPIRVVKKPTCVKTLKAMGLKVVDISFGLGWSVILTNSNEIYFAGRSIFPETWSSRQEFSTMDVGSEKFAVAEKIIALKEFSRVLKGEHIEGVVAGNDHFAVLTSTGKLFAWGRNDSNQIGQYDSVIPEPIDIDIGAPIKKVACGPKSTLMLTTDNRLYLTGTLSDFQYPRPTEINLTFPREEIIDMQITQSSEIYLVTGTGDIYKSVESSRSNNLSFTKFYDYDQDEKGIVVKLMKGNSFFVALTRAKKLFTTFSESGHHLKTFREISKFKNLKILDFAVGERHVLVLGVPKAARSVESSCRNLNTASTPARANVVANGYAATNGVLSQYEEHGFRELPSLKAQGKEQKNIDEENANKLSWDQVDEVEHGNQTISSPSENGADNKAHVKENEDKENNNTNSNSTLPIEEMQSQVQPDASKPKDDKPQTPFIKTDQSGDEKLISAPSLLPTAGLIRSRNGSARSIRFDESTIVHPKSTEKLNRPRTPYPDPSISPQIRKISISSEDDLNQTGTPALTDSLEHISENSQDSTDPPQTSRRASLKYSDRGLTAEQIQEITRVISAKVPVESGDKFTLLDDDEDFKVEIALNPDSKQNEIRFINDGIDVTKSVERLHKDIDELDETISEIPETALMIIETPKQAESTRTSKPRTVLHVLGEEPLAELADEKTIKNLKQMTQEDIMSLNGDDDLNQTESTSKDDSKLKTNRDEDDERTTASASSNIAANNFENDDSADDSRNKDSNSLPNTNDSNDDVDPETKKQKVRRFLNDLKTKGREMSCKNDHSVQVEDEPPKYSLSDHPNADQKTSKVCTIL